MSKLTSPTQKRTINTPVSTPIPEQNIKSPIAIDSTTLIEKIKDITDIIYQLNNTDVIDSEDEQYIYKAKSKVSSNDNSLSDFLKNSNKTETSKQKD